MAFRKVNKDFSDRKIAGFWSRTEGSRVVGHLVKYVNSINVAYPFFLVDLTEQADVNEKGSDTSHTANPGDLVAVMDAAALTELRDVKYEGSLVRITCRGMKEHMYKDTDGRKKKGSLRLYDVEVDDGEVSTPTVSEPLKPGDDDVPF